MREMQAACLGEVLPSFLFLFSLQSVGEVNLRVEVSGANAVMKDPYDWK